MVGWGGNVVAVPAEPYVIAIAFYPLSAACHACRAGLIAFSLPSLTRCATASRPPESRHVVTAWNEKGAKLCYHAGFHSFVQEPRPVSQVMTSC